MAVTYWVFGYGSLMWNPGFGFARSEPAMLSGAHRSLSVYSHRHRGTPEQPGLVFGLTRGGSCHGMAFEVAESNWPSVHAYLIERERDKGVYLEVTRRVRLASGEIRPALAFLVDESHAQYAGALDLREQARLVRNGMGQSGANIDYVLNTAEHLSALGIRDRSVLALAALLTSD